MLTRLSYRINLTLERYFPEQRLFLKSDETTRFIRLRPVTQATIVSVAVLTLCWTALGLGGWQSLGSNLLILAVMPTLIVRSILYFVETRLPGNIFIYIFVVVFMGSGLTIAAVSGLATLFLMGSGAYTYPFLFENWLVAMALNAWGEAFVTGMLLTIMVVYYPHLVTTFDDEHYLRNRKK